MVRYPQYSFWEGVARSMRFALGLGTLYFLFVGIGAVFGSTVIDNTFRGSIWIVAFYYLGGSAMLGFLHGTLRPWATSTLRQVFASILITIPVAFIVTAAVIPEGPLVGRILGSVVAGIFVGPVAYWALR